MPRRSLNKNLAPKPKTVFQKKILPQDPPVFVPPWLPSWPAPGRDSCQGGIMPKKLNILKTKQTTTVTKQTKQRQERLGFTNQQPQLQKPENHQHTHKHKPKHTHTPSQHTKTHKHQHKHKHTNTTNIQPHKHTNTQNHTLTHKHKHKHTITNKHKQTQTQAHTQPDTNTQTQTHTNTNTKNTLYKHIEHNTHKHRHKKQTRHQLLQKHINTHKQTKHNPNKHKHTNTETQTHKYKQTQTQHTAQTPKQPHRNTQPHTTHQTDSNNLNILNVTGLKLNQVLSTANRFECVCEYCAVDCGCVLPKPHPHFVSVWQNLKRLTTPTNLSHCKERCSLVLPMLHAALTLQVSNFLPSKAVTWQGCNIPTESWGKTDLATPCPAESAQRSNCRSWKKADLATARCWKSAAPANLTMLQHCTGKQIQHFELANLPMLHWHCKFPTCCQAKLSPGKVATLQICQSPTLQLGLKSSQEHWSNHPNSLAKGCPATPICTGFQLQVLLAKQIWPLQDVANLQPLPTWPCSNTALSRKSNTLNLPTCPRCTDTASVPLVAKQSCHLAKLQHCKSAKVQHSKPSGWKQPRALVKPPQVTGQRLPSCTNLHRVPTAGLGCRTDLATARCCKSAAPATLTMLQHCTVLPMLHWHCKFPTCCQAKLSPDKVATLQINQSPHCKPWGWKQPRTLKPPQLTGQRPICTGSNCRSWK